MLQVENWAEIRRLHRSEEMPIKVIARAMGISKNTVKAALRAEAPPRYERPSPTYRSGASRFSHQRSEPTWGFNASTEELPPAPGICEPRMGWHDMVWPAATPVEEVSVSCRMDL